MAELRNDGIHYLNDCFQMFGSRFPMFVVYSLVGNECLLTPSESNSESLALACQYLLPLLPGTTKCSSMGLSFQRYSMVMSISLGQEVRTVLAISTNISLFELMGSTNKVTCAERTMSG